MTVLSIEPLLAMVAQREESRGRTVTAVGLAGELGCCRESLRRWASTGVSVDVADRLAVAVGVHPVQVWPDWYAVSTPPASAPGLERLPSGRWRVAVRHAGRKRNTRSYATVAEAKAAGARLLGEMGGEA